MKMTISSQGFTTEEMSELLDYQGAERHYRGNVPVAADHKHNASLYVNVQLGYASVPESLQATLSVSRIDYIPADYFLEIPNKRPDLRRDYSLIMTIGEQEEFFKRVSIVTETLDAMHQDFEEVNPLDDDWDTKAGYERSLADVKTLAALFADDRLIIENSTTWDDGMDCELCGGSADELEITLITLDEAALYCDVRGRWGCYGGMQRREEGKAATQLWEAIQGVIGEPFWKTVEIAQEGMDPDDY